MSIITCIKIILKLGIKAAECVPILYGVPQGSISFYWIYCYCPWSDQWGHSCALYASGSLKIFTPDGASNHLIFQ